MSGLFHYLVFFLIIASIFGIASLGLNMQWGLSGQFNAGVVGFLAIGGYTAAIALIEPGRQSMLAMGLPFWLALLLAMIVTAAAGAIISLVTVKLRSDYLAIATFGIATTIQLLANNADPITGGARGLIGVPRPFSGLGRTDFDLAFLAMTMGLLVTLFVALEVLARSPWGRVQRAIRDDEVAAASLGKKIAAYRLSTFVLGSALLGLAGSLYVAYTGATSPADWMPTMTFQIWTMLIVGGSGSNIGAIAGAYLIWALWTASGIVASALLPPSLQVQGGAIQAVLIGVLLVATLLFRPAGLFGSRRR